MKDCLQKNTSNKAFMAFQSFNVLSLVDYFRQKKRPRRVGSPDNPEIYTAYETFLIYYLAEQLAYWPNLE